MYIMEENDGGVVEDIIGKVKKNRKYSGISDSVVKIEVERFLNRDEKVSEKELVREVRARLHRLYSSYQTKGKRKRERYLEELKEGKDVLDELLSITLSTKERLDSYGKIYSEIFKVTGKPKVIVDLGCGMNPLSYLLMKLDKVKYYAYDIDLGDVEYLNKYFGIMRDNWLNGKAKLLDVREIEEVGKLPKSDVVFMFKLIDLIDGKGKKVSEELIVKLLERTRFQRC